MFSLREGAVKGFSVLVTHATDCPVLFLYEKKKRRFYFPNNWHKWYQQPFSFTDKTKLMYHESFINIFTALNHFQASYKHNAYACYVVLDTCRVPNNFSPQRSGVKTLRADEKWKARYIYISCFYHRCNTKQPGRLFSESVQSLHQLTVTVCTFLCQSMPVYGLFSWYYFRLWKLIKIKVFTRRREMFLQTGRLCFKNERMSNNRLYIRVEIQVFTECESEFGIEPFLLMQGRWLGINQTENLSAV